MMESYSWRDWPLGGGRSAQVTQKTEAVKGAAVTTEQLTGEVWVQGIRSSPTPPRGYYSVFSVAPVGSSDGRPNIGGISPGTVLTATVTTTTQPVTVARSAASRESLVQAITRSDRATARTRSNVPDSFKFIGANPGSLS